MQRLVDCGRAQRGADFLLRCDACGGCPCGFDVWPGHPHEDEVRTLLARERGRLSDPRGRVDASNAAHALPTDVVRARYDCGQTVDNDDPSIEAVEESAEAET